MDKQRQNKEQNRRDKIEVKHLHTGDIERPAKEEGS
jgi:hypothetical protein